MATDLHSLYSTPPIAELRGAFVGKRLQDVATPAAILDSAVVRRNCSQMLEACKALQCSFRPHVKTHKVLYNVCFFPPQTLSCSRSRCPAYSCS